VHRILDKLFLLGGILAGVFLVMIGVLVVAQIVTRLLGTVIPSADEFAGYCLSASSFLGLAYAFRRGAHIRVTLFVQMAGSRVRWLVNLLASAVSCAMVTYFTWYVLKMVWDSWRFEDVTTGLVPIPLWLPQLGMAVGLVLFTIALIDIVVRIIVVGPTLDDRALAPDDIMTEAEQ